MVAWPSNLSPIEASTLVCAPLTAWNTLYGLHAVRAGDRVLTQGSGGVSMAAIQFARGAGACVIATTSSDEKAERLTELGAHHVINYIEDEDWVAAAKQLSPGVWARNMSLRWEDQVRLLSQSKRWQ
jgi:NADPH:quinone reductase-like Zn-dependent oxidoreductase